MKTLFKSINIKLIATYGFVVLFLMMMNVFSTNHYYRELLVSEDEKLSSTIGSLLSDSVNKLSVLGKYHLREFIEDIINRYPRVNSITVIDKYGTILASSDNSKNDKNLDGFLFSNGAIFTRDVDGGIKYVYPYFEQYSTTIAGEIEIFILDDEEHNSCCFIINYLNVIFALIGFILVIIISHYFSIPIRRDFDLLNNVTDSTKDLIYYKDLNHIFLGCNIAFANHINRSKRDIVGKNSILLEEDNALICHMSEDTVISKRITLSKEEKVLKDGKEIIYLKQTSPLIGSDGSIFGVVSISRDITDKYNMEMEINRHYQSLKELNENLEHRVNLEVENRAREQQILIEQSKLISMGEMIANIAHQWRQPLNHLGAVLQRIEVTQYKENINSAVISESTDNAKNIIKNMSNTIDDFINFYKPATKEDIFNVVDVVNESLTILDSTLKHHFIKLELDIDKSIKIYGFGNQFSQVLINLINNSKDALIEKNIKNPIIKILAYKKASINYIELIDNAGGINNNLLDKIFEPYFTTKKTGTGIGLYMSKIIIEKNMRGKLFAKNSKDGAVMVIKIKDTIKS
jgi:PAS domain S-box-containing protein